MNSFIIDFDFLKYYYGNARKIEEEYGQIVQVLKRKVKRTQSLILKNFTITRYSCYFFESNLTSL